MANGIPQILPITYYYDKEHHSIITYSGEGDKIIAMRKNGIVAFQVDDIMSLDRWKSVLLYGKYEELGGVDAKHLLHVFSEGVKKILLAKDNTTPQFINEFSSRKDTKGAHIVYRINILEVKGRQRDE